MAHARPEADLQEWPAQTVERASRDHVFGLWVRRLRVSLDLTQETLAEQVGCATQTMRSFESGRRRPSRELAARIADTLQVPPDEREQFLRLARVPILPQEETILSATTPAVDVTSLRTFLIGRRRELDELRRLLVVERRRLVTLLGPGGVGKTQLALHAAANLADSFPDGSVMVPLAHLTDPADIPAAIAAATGCPLAGGAEPAETLLGLLRERSSLLVLDNLEHLLVPARREQTRGFLTALVRAAPGITLLTTSRERVAIHAEWSLELDGLALPSDDWAEDVVQAEAVMLFVERARRVTNRFTLTPQNQVAVAAICRRLDGLPLAIELAAAQVAFLTPAAIQARLSEALPLLVSDDQDAPERQRTMRAAIQWSDELLYPEQRRLFYRLAVFTGSFSLEAVEAVGITETSGRAEVLGMLRRLVEQSLVMRADTPDDAARYRLLEPLRQYALERLAAAGEEARSARQRAAAYYCTLAETAEPLLRGARQAYWLDQLEADYPNLRVSMTWLLEQGELETAARLGHALWLFLWLRGHLAEGGRWMEQILAAMPKATSLARAHALLAACVLVYGQARYDLAAQLARAALAQYQALDHAAGVADAVSMEGLVAAVLQEHERAVALMADAVSRYLAVGNRWGAAMTLNYWAPLPLARGEYAEAARLAEQALGLAQETGDQVAVYSALYNQAQVAERQGDWGVARRRFREALTCAQTLGDLGSCLACLVGLGGVAAVLGDGARAARLWGAAYSLRTNREAAVYGYAANADWYARMEATARAAVSPDVWEQSWCGGHRLTLRQVIAEVLNEAISE
jgi:predicted ATPase/DNA-binding XRE family transcriptional regulator